METIYLKIGQLHEKYKDSPKTLDKLNTYIHKHLPQLLEKCNQQEKKILFLEKESQLYINEFLTDPNLQFFYISPTDTFINIPVKIMILLTKMRFGILYLMILLKKIH